MWDPLLYKIDEYRFPGFAKSCAETYAESNQLLWREFEEAVQELKAEGVYTKLWLNIEAFEYTRNEPCTPIDEGGNGMAELLDRTTKSRLDWALTVEGARASHIISFAWDADYLCKPSSAYPLSLAEEIQKDWDRPIVSYLDPINGVIRGFNLAENTVTYSVKCASGKTGTDKPLNFDANWGKKNDRSPLLQQITVATQTSVIRQCSAESWVCITATNSRTGKAAYHEYCSEQGVHP